MLAITSPDRLHRDWRAAQAARQAGDRNARAPIETLLAPLGPGAGLVSVIDGHPATLSWLGSVRRLRQHALGVDHFGQSGDIPDLFRHYGIDAEAILDAAAQLCLD